jgi:very-short-patch-repair endonuclease
MRKQVKGVFFHVFSGKEEYRKLEYDRFWVTSPAMTWAQMARYCNREELATVGAALMSRDRRRKVTTMRELRDYLDASPKFCGRNRCFSALAYMTENTDSPPETQLYGTLTDSGLGRPVANYRVDFGDTYVMLDMAYPDCKVAFEYQGAYHADPARMRADAARTNLLQKKGWVIVLVTADDLRTSQSRKVFLSVAQTIVNRQRWLTALYRSWATA